MARNFTLGRNSLRPGRKRRLSSPFPMHRNEREYRHANYTGVASHSVSVVSLRSAFTLIQLLVAMAIIGLLAAFTISALSKARDTALLTACANNIRQISQAGNHYRAQNAGLWPPLQFSSGFSDFTLFAPHVSSYDVFRSPASNVERIIDQSDLMEISDYAYINNMNGQFTDNDFSKGFGNINRFDPSDPLTNRLLSYLFNRNTIQDYIFFNADPNLHNGVINIAWLRNGRVEQRDPMNEMLPNMAAFQAMYEDGADLNQILNDLDIPPGTEVKCLHCGGSGQVMNPANGSLQSDPACGGTGIVSF